MKKTDDLGQELEFGDILVVTHNNSGLYYGIYIPSKGIKTKIMPISLGNFLKGDYGAPNNYGYGYYVYNHQSVKYPFDKTQPDYIIFLNELKRLYGKG